MRTEARGNRRGRRAALALLLPVLAACGGEPEGTRSTEPPPLVESPSPSESASTSSEEGLTALERRGRVAFLMPSQNVACLIEELGIMCDIRNTAYQHTIAAARNCPEPTVELYEEEPVWTCSRSSRFVDAQVRNEGGWVRTAGGTTERINGIDHAVLDYGESLELFGHRCESKETGVECRRLEDGRRFRLATHDFELH